MHKRLKAYMTIEASFVFSILIVLYYLIVMASITLFFRCIDGNKMYISELREARLTYKEGSYGEVIYNEIDDNCVDSREMQIFINPIGRIRKDRK